MYVILCPSKSVRDIRVQAVPPNTHPLSCHGKGCIEPLLEGAAALEDSGQEEVEQGPQFWQLVLERGAGEEEAPRSHVVGVQYLGQLAVVVLHAVALVHNHVLPANLCVRGDWLGPQTPYFGTSNNAKTLRPNFAFCKRRSAVTAEKKI